MKKNRKVKYGGRWRQGQELARELKAEEYARVEGGGKVYWWWSGMMEISELAGKKRVVILWEGEVGKGEPVFWATNAYWWHRERVVAFYRGRWGKRRCTAMGSSTWDWETIRCAKSRGSSGIGLW